MYDASTTKLAKHTAEDGVPLHISNYIGSFVYEDNELQYLLTSEGRVVVDGSNYEYHVFYILSQRGGAKLNLTLPAEEKEKQQKSAPALIIIPGK
ncbi:MAG: hypothetical protein K9H16_08080 [Bacteroidales bacterium]|nr:hypothetical protein [Bacteroidales bacterium]